MSALAVIALILGVVLVAASLPGIVAPARLRSLLAAFPRSRWPAWALTAVDLSWVAWVVSHAALGRFEFLKPLIWFAAPLGFALVVVFMDELLAPRALGGLLLLLAAPVVRIARWHDSDWRVIMVLIAYAWAVAGMVLILSPWKFRQLAAWAGRTDGRLRLISALRAGAGACLVVLALTVY